MNPPVSLTRSLHSSSSLSSSASSSSSLASLAAPTAVVSGVIDDEISDQSWAVILLRESSVVASTGTGRRLISISAEEKKETEVDLVPALAIEPSSPLSPTPPATSSSSSSSSSSNTSFRSRIEGISEEFQSSICFELMIAACVLPCSRSYCFLCISRWLLDHSDCPSCRAKVNDGINSAVSVKVIDNTIMQLEEGMEKEQKEERQNNREEAKQKEKEWKDSEKKKREREAKETESGRRNQNRVAADAFAARAAGAAAGSASLSHPPLSLSSSSSSSSIPIVRRMPLATGFDGQQHKRGSSLGNEFATRRIRNAQRERFGMSARFDQEESVGVAWEWRERA